LTSTHVLELWSTRKNNIDPFTFVGDFERLFYNHITKTIHVSDGQTPGGLPLSGGGSSSAEAIYSTIVPPATTNGLMWFDPSSDTLYVASGGVWVAVGSSGSDGAVTLYSTETPAVGENGLLWYNPSTNVLSVVNSGVWTVISSSSDLADLDGIEIIDPVTGDALVYDGTNFTNVPLNLSGGDENQILVKKSGSNYDYEWEDMIINVPDNVYTKLLDQVSSELLYLGEAAPDSLENQNVWRIQKITFDALGNVLEVRYAAGGLFDQIWNNRTSLVYI